MSLTREIKSGVKWVGAIDWDRRLFDALIPLPEGTSYNSYLIQGSEKTVLIDAVDESMADVLQGNLSALGIKRIDYIIAQHAEQDHSGSLKMLLGLYPDARVLGSAKCLDLLMLFGLVNKDQVQEVKDGEKISLGDKSLEFIHAPWVHWPDTIFTYLAEERILFTCDFLGSHLASSDLYASDEARRIPGCQEILCRDHDALSPEHQPAPGQDCRSAHGCNRSQPRSALCPAKVHIGRLPRLGLG